MQSDEPNDGREMLSDAEWVALDRVLAGEARVDQLPARGFATRLLGQFERARGTVLDLDRFRAGVWRRTGNGADAHAAASRVPGEPIRPSKTADNATRQLGGRVAQRIWLMAAGAAIGVAALVGGWHALTAYSRGHQQVAMTAYVTGNGERAAITLPDGNTILLNVGSRLEVPVNYMGGNRTLRLSGEALFTVLRHDAVPFSVTAGPTTARVLGTSFIVRRYATDTMTTVAVRDGKVAVHSVVLTASRLAEFGSNGASRVRRAGSSAFSFAAGVLTIDDQTLADAIPELNRWYDADIRLGDPALAAQRLTGDLPAGSLAELTHNLEVTLNVRVVREGRVLTLFPR